MSKVLITDTYLTNIADAIRAKNSSSTTYKPSAMASAITALDTSGSGSSSGVDLDDVEIYVGDYADSDTTVTEAGAVNIYARIIIT